MCFVLTSILCVSTIFAESLVSLACVSSGTHNNPRLIIIFVVFRTQKRNHCARRSLRRPWKLGLRIVAWSKPRLFCKESLRKSKFRAFPKRVGSRILWLESVDHFGTSEHY